MPSRLFFELMCGALFLLAAVVLAEEANPAKLRILVLCTGNSARSQMSAGLLQSWDQRLEVQSAGTDPAPRVNPFAVRAMKEVGVDISSAYPKSVQKFLGQPFDYVITVCDDADKNCPNFSGKVGKRIHIGFPDPARVNGSDGQKLAAFRSVRDDIGKRFRAYYESEMKTRFQSAR
jgi:arsenate reductase